MYITKLPSLVQLRGGLFKFAIAFQLALDSEIFVKSRPIEALAVGSANRPLKSQKNHGGIRAGMFQ
jgi:hypothetical protein